MGAGPAHEPSQEQLRRRGPVGWFFTAVWLLYLAGVLSSDLENEHLALRVIGVVLLVAFGVLYLGTFVVARRARQEGRSLSPWWFPVATIGTATAMTVAQAYIAGQSALVMGTFLAVMGLFTLPLRPALGYAATIVVLTAVLPQVIQGWESDGGSTAIGTATAALAVTGIMQLIQRNLQLDEAREELSRLAVEEERTRFARDLHDLLGHSLTVVTVKAELAGRLVHADPDRAEKEIREVEQLARDALADVRSAVAGFRGTTLARELVSARTALDAAGIEADLPNAIDHVPGDRRELFGWAVREGVTNVVRHSGARHCRVVVSPQAAEIVDDGRGPTTEGDSPPGTGLAGLRERAAEAGAGVTVGRGEQGGFRLRVGW